MEEEIEEEIRELIYQYNINFKNRRFHFKNRKIDNFVKDISDLIIEEKQEQLKELRRKILDNSYKWEVEISKSSPYEGVHKGIHHDFVMSAINMRNNIIDLIEEEMLIEK